MAPGSLRGGKDKTMAVSVLSLARPSEQRPLKAALFTPAAWEEETFRFNNRDMDDAMLPAVAAGCRCAAAHLQQVTAKMPHGCRPPV